MAWLVWLRENGQWISALIAGASAVIAAVALALAYRSFHANRKHAEDKERFDQALLALERAYNCLTNDGENTDPPSPDRQNWLTTARHILAYQRMKTEIKTNVYKSRCDDSEEYWRHRFYLALQKLRTMSSYYGQQVPPATGGPLDRTSALVVHHFAAWLPTKDDPLDAVDRDRLLNELGPALQRSNPVLWAHVTKPKSDPA